MARSRKKDKRYSLDDQSGRYANTHLHVFLINPKNGEKVVLSKGDHEEKIEKLIRLGWREVKRID